MAVPLERRRFTVDEYHRMEDAGILGEDDRVELLEGEIVQMMPIGPGHAGRVDRLAQRFFARVGERAIVRVQNPIVLGPHSEPQPDLALLRPREDFYTTAHPGPEDVLLVVEVADTSVAVEREVKVRLYARAGIPEVWIANLPEDHLEVFRDPGPEGYRQVLRLRRGERIAARALPDLDISVNEALG